MKLKLIRNLILIGCLALLTGGVGYRLGANELRVSLNAGRPNLEVVNRAPEKSGPADFSLFWNVWEKLQQKYVDKTKLDAKRMVYGAISGMVASLDDPYTVFLPPKENREAKEQLNGNFEGIGAQLGIKDKRIIVVAPLADSPAEKAGVKTSDWIIKVDGKETAGWTLPEAVSKIRGPKGSSVALSVLHEGDQKPLDIKIIRQAIVLKSVDWKVVSSTASASLKGAVYIDLARFGDNTHPQWDKVAQGVDNYLATASGQTAGVILDVRNNPGGYLAGSVYVASEFLPSGVIVKQVHYDGTTQTYSVERQGKLLEVPMVVLINQGTASASEILAGSLAVAKRAKIVGMQSFGKGSVQETEDLPDGAGLHITAAKWLLADDTWIQGKGLTPDVKVENDENQPDRDLQLDKAILVLNGRN